MTPTAIADEMERCNCLDIYPHEDEWPVVLYALRHTERLERERAELLVLVQRIERELSRRVRDVRFLDGSSMRAAIVELKKARGE